MKIVPIAALCLVAILAAPSAALARLPRPAPKLTPHKISLANGKRFTLDLPDGYTIVPAAQGLRRVRFMAPSPDGRIFVTDMFNRADNTRGAVYILDGFDPESGRFAKVTTYLTRLRNPNSLAFHTGADGVSWLYLALTDRLVRYRYAAGDSAPSSAPEVLATFPAYGLNYKYGGWHLTRTIAIGPNQKVYVSVGSSCNACREKEAVRATVLEMNLDGSGQRVFAAGLRNAVGLRWVGARLIATNMGADHLGDDKPEDPMYALRDGAHYGWPHYYHFRSRVYADPRFPAPRGRPRLSEVPTSFASFAAHSSPLGFDFFGEETSDPSLKGSFLVALHGASKTRLGRGYRIALVREGDAPSDFVTGFLRKGRIHGRPADVMRFGKDAFLFTDDLAGVVYYVSWRGERPR